MNITRKELDKSIKIATKKIMKKYGYKMRGNVLYKEDKNYFISIFLGATGIHNNLINVRGTIKPYIFDNLFWEIFKMSENTKEPVSLRANGAFSVKGLQVYNQNKEVEDYDDVSEIVLCLLSECDRKMDEILNKVENDLKKFIDYSKKVETPGLYKTALAEMLFEIKEMNYQKAIKIAQYEMVNHRYGNMENEGKDIYEHIIEYCNQKIGG